MKKGQEPAFACECMSANGSDGHLQEGMSKRFYAACACIGSLISIMDKSDNPIEVVEVAYMFADELLKQENEES